MKTLDMIALLQLCCSSVAALLQLCHAALNPTRDSPHILVAHILVAQGLIEQS